jgi:hypothetical protein
MRIALLENDVNTLLSAKVKPRFPWSLSFSVAVGEDDLAERHAFWHHVLASAANSFHEIKQTL